MTFVYVDSCQVATFVAGENVLFMSMYNCNNYVVQFKRSCIIFQIYQ
jgi:hypothetical protein